MGDSELSTEELRNLKEKLAEELTELQHELQIVVAATSNPKQTQLIQGLKRQKKYTKHTKELLRIQNQKKMVTDLLANDSLIDYYKTLTGIIINITFQFLPKEFCYLYNVECNIDNFKFNINYCSNKAPNKSIHEPEDIKQMKIELLEEKTMQLEIQEGLDFFSKRPYYIPTAILFLKSVKNLVNIRNDICNTLIQKFNEFCFVGTQENTGYLCIYCKGIVHPSNNIFIRWGIIWTENTMTATDSFKANVSISDDVTDLNPFCAKLCTPEKWKILSTKEKCDLLETIVNFVKYCDTKEALSESQAYSSFG